MTDTTLSEAEIAELRRAHEAYPEFHHCWECDELRPCPTIRLLVAVEAHERECQALAADQCHDGVSGEYGEHRCRIIDALAAERDALRDAHAFCEEAITAQRIIFKAENERLRAVVEAARQAHDALGLHSCLIVEDKPCAGCDGERALRDALAALDVEKPLAPPGPASEDSHR